MDIFTIYLWTRIDAVKEVLLIAAILMSVIGPASVLAVGINCTDAEMKQYAKRLFKWLLPTIALMMALNVALPTKNDIALIIAGTATYRAITSERGSKIASAFADYIEAQALALLEKKK